MLAPVIVVFAISAPVIEASEILTEVTALSANFVASTALALILAVVIALLLIVTTPPTKVASPESVVAEFAVPLPVSICPLLNSVDVPVVSFCGTQLVPFHFNI